MFMFSQLNWGKPQTWHQTIVVKTVNTAGESHFNLFFRWIDCTVCTNCVFGSMDSSALYFPNLCGYGNRVYLRRNDAFISGCLYLLVGAAVGAPVFAEGGSELFSSGKLIASGGYLLAFPFASALVAEGLDRQGLLVLRIKAQLICWYLAMIPVYVIGTLWLAESYSVDFC